MKRSTWEYIITGQAIVILALVGYAFWRHTIPGLITEMRLGNTLSRAEAASELGSKGPSAAAAAPILKQIMQDTDNLAALRAGEALRKIAGPGPLVEMMASPLWEEVTAIMPDRHKNKMWAVATVASGCFW